MRRLLPVLVLVFVLLGGLVVAAWEQGWVTSPWARRHAELVAQLRDRGAVAVAGGVPVFLTPGDTPLIQVRALPGLAAALAGRAPARVADELRRTHADGLLVRTDADTGSPGSVHRALAELHPVAGLAAVYLDDAAALYETADPIEVSPDEARRLITVTRLVLAGAAAPPERLFPEPLRRARPVEVVVTVRDGHDPIIWRATRGGSVARALLDATFAVLDRWTTRQQERYGTLHEAMATKALTIAFFYDKGVLGSRSPDFLRRAADPRVFAVGFERLSNWEYVLPPTPWSHGDDPARALADLARDRGVPAPGYQRPEITLYRFRAYQIIELAPGGEIQIYDPS